MSVSVSILHLCQAFHVRLMTGNTEFEKRPYLDFDEYLDTSTVLAVSVYEYLDTSTVLVVLAVLAVLTVSVY